MDDFFDLAKVWGVNCGTIGVVTFTELEYILKFILLLASICYTCMKITTWLREEKNRKNNHKKP